MQEESDEEGSFLDEQEQEEEEEEEIEEDEAVEPCLCFSEPLFPTKINCLHGGVFFLPTGHPPHEEPEDVAPPPNAPAGQPARALSIAQGCMAYCLFSPFFEFQF